MPYPLPEEGPPYTADLRWFLVAVPDDVAFVRAAMGAYTEFTHFWKWGHEGKEPGRNEAAQAWEAAVAATLEALEMGFPDILLSHIDEVEGLLRQLRDRPCCGSGATDTIPNPTEGGGGIVPVGIEDVPDFTDNTDIVANPPQTSFTDADEDAETTGPEMVEYLCAAAHWYYDLLHRWLSFMKLYSTLGGLVWEPVSAIINLVVSRYGGSNPIATVAVEVADQLVNLWPEVNTAMVDAIIAELEANRDDIICAIAVERNLAGMISAVYSQLQTITTALGYLNMLPMVSYPVFAMALVSQGLIDLSDVEGSCDCEYLQLPEGYHLVKAQGLSVTLNENAGSPGYTVIEGTRMGHSGTRTNDCNGRWSATNAPASGVVGLLFHVLAASATPGSNGGYGFGVGGGGGHAFPDAPGIGVALSTLTAYDALASGLVALGYDVARLGTTYYPAGEFGHGSDQSPNGWTMDVQPYWIVAD